MSISAISKNTSHVHYELKKPNLLMQNQNWVIYCVSLSLKKGCRVLAHGIYKQTNTRRTYLDVALFRAYNARPC